MNRIVPAGHTHTIASKAYAAESKSDLEKVFLEWCGLSFPTHASAHKLLRQTDFTIDDIHHQAIKHPQIEIAGLFLSAGYALCNENVIIYDLNIPLDFVGIDLSQDKLLVNRGLTGNDLGSRSRGVILNLGQARDDFGFNSEGIIINAGHTGKRFGKGWLGHIAIAMNNPESYDYKKSYQRNLRPEEIQGELKTYLNELTELCHGPTEHIHARYGDNPSTTIQHDIRRLLKESEQ